MILGVDPGSNRLGYAVIHGERLVELGELRLPQHNLPEKLSLIYTKIDDLLSIFHARAVACEDQFAGKNQKTLKVLSAVKGVIMLCAAQHGTEFFQYPPATVKLHAAGKGSASKEEVLEAVRKLYLVQRPMSDHESDALAVAHTHIELHERGSAIVQLDEQA